MNNEVNFGIIEARYTAAQDSKFAGNPFYEALPTDEELYKELNLFRDMPLINDSIRETSTDKEKLNLLDNIEDGFFLLLHHFKTFENINKLIKRGYLNRNPLSKEYVEEVNRLGRELQSGIFNNQPYVSQNGFLYAEGGSKIMSMIGVAGTGKSTTSRIISKMYYRAIEHSDYNGKHFNALQIPCITIKCPSECSLQSICCDYFQEIDNLTGMNYRLRYGGTTRDISIMVNRMRSLGALYGIGLLIIDELQDLVDSKQDTSTVKTFISQLANKVGFPILLIGTVKVKSLFTTGSSTRRIISGGEDIWDRMEENDDEWNHVTAQLWDLRVLNDKRDIMPEEIKKALYLASQGNLCYLKTIYLDAQRIAIETNIEAFTVDLIESALKDNPSILRIITAIINNDTTVLAELGDVVISEELQNIDSYKKNLEYKEKIESITKTIVLNRELRSKEQLKNICSCIREVEMGRSLNEEQLEAIVGKVIKKNQEDTPEVILLKALEAVKQESEDRKSRKRKKNESSEISKGEFSYDSYIKNGYIAEDL